jgi:hypothetical protein
MAVPGLPAASSLADGVSHPAVGSGQDGPEEEPLADVRGARARSAQIGGPDGIAQSFQVSAYTGEPPSPSRARNLLSKDDWRAALGDEPKELWPKMSMVSFPQALAGGAEGLAGAGARPDGEVGGESGEAQGLGPASDPGKEVALGEASKVICLHLQDAAVVDGGLGDQPLGG